ncbi:MAG: hypothetical protein IT235_08105 [Bacteroidia bacterium]|nr:hypothetical protein [Bacteroidia bacterium]
MKKLFFMASLFIALSSKAQTTTYEYKMFTTIESVVPGGLGRSRLIETEGRDQDVSKDMENFFSLVGINFKNIESNDKMIAKKMNEYSKDGWDLTQTIPGVYSADKSTGIFITRYVFRRPLKN